MRLIGWIAAAGLVSIVAVACGGSSSNGGNTGGTSAVAGSPGASGAGGEASAGIPFDQAPGLYAAALCKTINNCYGDLFAILRPGEDCIKNTSVQLEEAMQTLQTSIDAGTVTYHGDKLQTCLTSSRRQTAVC